MKTINCYRFLLLLTTSLLFVSQPLVSVAFAATPLTTVYEGRLLSSTGTPKTTSHTFRFSLWSDADFSAGDVDGAGAINTGATGYGGWSESQTITPNSNGTVSANLGSAVALPTIDFTNHKYLQVEVKVSGAADTTYQLLDPTGDAGADTNDRQTIGSVPYSKTAQRALTSSDMTFIVSPDSTDAVLQFGSGLDGQITYTDVSDIFDFDANRITNLVNPTGDQDAATKNYVDALVNGLAWKDAVLHGNQFVDGGSGGIRSGGKITVSDETQVNENDTIAMTYNSGGTNFVLTAKDAPTASNCEFKSGTIATDNNDMATSILTAIDACASASDFSGQSTVSSGEIFLVHYSVGAVGDGTIVMSGSGFTDVDMEDGTAYGTLVSNETRLVTGSNIIYTHNASDVWTQITGVQSIPTATTTSNGTVELATDGETSANVVVQGNDSRLHTQNTDTGTTSSDFKINSGADTTSTLTFGNMLNKILSYDTSNTYFNFNDHLNIAGNITVTGTVDGVDVAALDTTVIEHLDGGVNKHDATEIDVETVGNITTAANLETNLAAFDAAVGNRTYTQDNYVTDGQVISASIDALDQQMKLNGDLDTLAELTDTTITVPAAGHLAIYDGVDSWDNKVMSGDATITSTGAITIGGNAVALGTDTTGNYVTSLTNGAGITGADGGSESATLSLALDINGIAAESVINDADTVAIYDASAGAIRKMTRANLLSGVTGALVYQGAWNASTNSPTLTDGTGTVGNYYAVATADVQNLGNGSITFTIGDWVVHNGTVWEKLDSTNDVQSVFGRTGIITSATSDYDAIQIDNTATGNIAATNVQAAINELDTEKQGLHSNLTDISGLANTDGNFIVGNGTNFVEESGATVRTSLGLGTADSPTFAGMTMDAQVVTDIFDEDNMVSDSNTALATQQSIKAYVDTAVHTQNTDTGTTSNIFTLDFDNTGGNVDLVFGATINEMLRHDGTLFHFTDDVRIDTIGKIEFRDSALAINSSVDGQLDIDADTEIEITAPTVDLNGNLEVSGTITGATIDGDDNTLQDIAWTSLKTRTKKVTVDIGDIAVIEDGSNNFADLYIDSETGVNPHQFYLVKSTQAGLNDLDLIIKVRLPEDFVDFTTAINDLSFFYKNTGVDSTDSKIDILVEDDDGDDAYTAADGQGLFNTAWTAFADEFDGALFDPAAGEYIYIIIKSYASYDGGYQSPYVGELVLTYTGR